MLLARNKDQLPRSASASAARLSCVSMRQRNEDRYPGPFSRGEHYFLKATMSKLRLPRIRCFCPLSHQWNLQCTFLPKAPDFRKNAVWFDILLTLAACPSDKSSMQMSMCHRWKDNDSGRTHYMERNLSRCHSVHHKSHMDWPGIEIASLRWDPINPRLPACSRPW